MRSTVALRFVIFDLDDTLYSCGNGLMQEVGSRIEAWLRMRLGLTTGEAVELRRRYYLQYGTALGGLIEERDVDAAEFLAFVHDIPVERYVEPAPDLSAMLGSMPLRKAVYSNAAREYCKRILDRLGVSQHFEQVIGIEEADLRNKPYLDAYEKVLQILGADGPQCLMVEDSARNLRPAKQLGMTTVLVRLPRAAVRFSDQADVGGRHDDVVDFVVESVLELGPIVERLIDGRDD